MIAAEVPSDGARVVAVTVPEAVGVGGDDLDVQCGHAELVRDELRVLGLVPVGLGRQAQHHLAGRVDAQKHRSIRLVSHCPLPSWSWGR